MNSVVETTLVARDGLAVRQWEAHLLDDAARAGERAWLSPRLASAQGWRQSLWLDAAGDIGEPLSTRQSEALWRHVIAGSRAGAALLDRDGPAVWAGEAWRQLAAWGIDPSELRASSQQPDFAAFLGWCRTYRQRLQANAWLDAAEISRRLPACSLQPGRVTLLDWLDTSPADAGLLQHLGRSGWHVVRREVVQQQARWRRVALPDGEAELAAAVSWAAAKLSDAPRSRIALVVADAESRRAELARVLDAAGASETFRSGLSMGRSVLDNPFVGAALNALQLLSPRGSFVNLSRCLTSPWTAGGELSQRSSAAMLELDLRTSLVSQVGFLDAYRTGGLRARLEGTVPEFAARLGAALQDIALDKGVKTPTAWVSAWQKALGTLLSGGERNVDPNVVAAWDGALQAFAEQTPIVGGLAAGTALEEFGKILERSGREGPLPLYGVHVVAHMDQVGPGYDGVWVTGMTDASWPEPARSNPLLPRALQIAHEMPWATPADALHRSVRSLRRLRARSPDSVLSWPQVQYDYRTQPSALLEGAELAAAAEFGVPGAATAGSAMLRSLATVCDPAPPFTATRIRGGARTLDLQAQCPLRAFCDSRLATRAVEALVRGIGPRRQGIAIHRALELLMQGVRDSEPGSRTLRERIAPAAKMVLDELFGAARRQLSAFYELELERLYAVLEGFLDAESRRPPYRVDRLESRGAVSVGQQQLHVRIDRVDRLDDGSLAVIDYKTGRFVSRPRWFDERIGDTQLPLYLLDLGHEVSSLVIAAVAAPNSRYLGYWPEQGAFPGRPARLPEGRAWAAQRDVWRAQIEALVADYVRGDIRIYADALEPAKAAYAPLTRIYEVAASSAEGRHG